MRLGLALAGVVLLTACASPREACIRHAGSELRLLDQQIEETEAALARGYRVTQHAEARTTLHICAWPREPVLFCTRHTPGQTATRVAAEREVEEARLAELQRERTQMVIVTADRMAACPAP